ncbi:hypothetical protein CSOJ01_10893 [Colletotrichum sojae]|uniref:Uncharacterized protein n=1 Tax=Colletotrichum sojae TaxID=2175907 RepID=A0A8H6MPL8_9PEZI|nr:hypothetical protein CSOJ01_10893 [Colletotrichum sojae]
MPFEFLRLPREIRDMIYEEYFRLDGGYLCDTDAFLKGSLSTSSGEPVDLSLVYTCKMVAEETEYGNVALGFNTVTFTTLYSPEHGELALFFRKLMMDGVGFIKAAMLNSACHQPTESSVSKLKSRYPQFAPLLHRLKPEDPVTGHDLLSRVDFRGGSYGEAPSLYHEFVDETLRTAAEDPKASLAVRDFVVPWNLYCERNDAPPPGLEEYQRRRLRSGFEIIDNHSQFWEIPSPSDMDELIRLTKYTVSAVCPEVETKYRFSAAAVAIYFLKNMSPNVCRHLRRLVLLEDKRSLCYPESHALGLIPFCQKYPKLNIERRARLWTNVFLQGVEYDGMMERQWIREYRQAPQGDLFSINITPTVAPWVIEASRLAKAGMPPGSFSLLLESAGANELATEIFESVVHKDIAWQEAWMTCSEMMLPFPPHLVSQEGRESLRHASWNLLLPGGVVYPFENLARAMRDIVEGKSVVRCDFHPGTPWDVGPIVEQHKYWNEEKWEVE